MGKLWDDIIRFVDTEVIPELLLAKLQSRGKPKPAIAHIKIDNHPSLLETKLVKLTTSSYTITIPRNWICRLCLIFQLVDSMENADESRSRIYIFDTDHAFEAHFLTLLTTAKHLFLACQIYMTCSLLIVRRMISASITSKNVSMRIMVGTGAFGFRSTFRIDR